MVAVNFAPSSRRTRRRAGQRPADHGRDRPAGAARRVRRRVGRNAAGRCSGRAPSASARCCPMPGARWVSTSVEPAMAMGPNTVVVVRSEYLLGFNNCPNYSPATNANPNEAAMPGFGCADVLQHGPDAGRAARRRGRPPGRTGRRDGERGRDRALPRRQGSGAQYHRHDRRWPAPARAPAAAAAAADRRPRATEAACRLLQLRSVRRPLPARKSPRSAPWPSCRTPSRCRACRPTCST